MKILCSNPALRPFLERLPEAFAAGEGEIIYDKRNQVRRFIVTLDGRSQTIIVKRFKRPNVLQTLSYSTLWRNKAEKAYLYAERLLQMGIDTPRPLGAVTLRNGIGLVSQYFFASSEDTAPSCLCLRDGTSDDPDGLIGALAEYLITLHEKGFLHGDTNLSNFLYRRSDDGRYTFSVIDINRSTFLDHPATRREALANLFRLTHVRPLLERLIGQYARRRGWDEREALADVTHALDRFEQRKAFFRWLKGKR